MSWVYDDAWTTKKRVVADLLKRKGIVAHKVTRWGLRWLFTHGRQKMKMDVHIEKHDGYWAAKGNAEQVDAVTWRAMKEAYGG